MVRRLTSQPTLHTPGLTGSRELRGPALVETRRAKGHAATDASDGTRAVPGKSPKGAAPPPAGGTPASSGVLTSGVLQQGQLSGPVSAGANATVVPPSRAPVGRARYHQARKDAEDLHKAFKDAVPGSVEAETITRQLTALHVELANASGRSPVTEVYERGYDDPACVAIMVRYGVGFVHGEIKAMTSPEGMGQLLRETTDNVSYQRAIAAFLRGAPSEILEQLPSSAALSDIRALRGGSIDEEAFKSSAIARALATLPAKNDNKTLERIAVLLSFGVDEPQLRTTLEDRLRTASKDVLERLALWNGSARLLVYERAGADPVDLAFAELVSRRYRGGPVYSVDTGTWRLNSSAAAAAVVDAGESIPPSWAVSIASALHSEDAERLAAAKQPIGLLALRLLGGMLESDALRAGELEGATGVRILGATSRPSDRGKGDYSGFRVEAANGLPQLLAAGELLDDCPRLRTAIQRRIEACDPRELTAAQRGVHAGNPVLLAAMLEQRGAKRLAATLAHDARSAAAYEAEIGGAVDEATNGDLLLWYRGRTNSVADLQRLLAIDPPARQPRSAASSTIEDEQLSRIEQLRTFMDEAMVPMRVKPLPVGRDPRATRETHALEGARRFIDSPYRVVLRWQQLEREVALHAQASGMTLEDAREEVMNAWERRAGFAPVFTLDNYRVYDGDEWAAMLRDGRLFFDTAFQDKDREGTTHGGLTHRVQWHLLMREMIANPSAFAVPGEPPLSPAELFRALGTPELEEHVGYPIWPEFFDSGAGNFSQPEYLRGVWHDWFPGMGRWS